MPLKLYGLTAPLHALSRQTEELQTCGVCSVVEAPPSSSSSAAPCLGSRHSEVVINGQRYALVPVSNPSCPAVQGSLSEESQLPLTAREIQVVRLVANGMVNKQIAGVLQISEWTVSTHLRRIFSKLGVDTRAAMVSRCMNSLIAHESPLG